MKKLVPFYIAVSLITLCLVISGSSTVQANYCFSLLDFGSSNYTTFSHGINDSDRIVGSYVDGQDVWHGFLYADGKFTSIDVDFPGVSMTMAPIIEWSPWFPGGGINDSGDIVGSYEEWGGRESGFLYSHGVFTSVDVPGITHTYATGINNFGNIVGFYDDDKGWNNSFLYAGGRFTSFDVPGASGTYAYGINNSDDIVGFYDEPWPQSRSFLYQRGSLTFIDAPSAINTWAYGINDSGNIVGSYQDAARVFHGFLYAGGNFISVDVPGAIATWATGINNSGKIVGYYSDASGWHDFVTKSCNPTLTVSKSGTGSRTVTSSPTGINCGSDCTEDYVPGTVVTLTATPSTGSTFASWSGPCSGTGTCKVTINSSITVMATFALKTPHISVSTISIDFGKVKVDKKGSKTFKITNKGVADLVATFSGLEGSDFGIQGSSSITIKPNKSYSAKTLFIPKSKGSKTATLNVNSNDPSMSRVVVTLTGIGN